MLDGKKEEQLKLMAAAISRLQKLNLNDCFDPIDPNSRPTPAQLQVIKDFGGKIKKQFITAGNQCKPAYSLVKMADGTQKPISQIKVGDWVLGLDFKTEKAMPVQVIKTWNNGEKDVYRYHFSAHQFTDSTPNHQMVYHNGKSYLKSNIEKRRDLIILPSIIEGTKQEVPKNGIELLGFLLGDGCFTKLKKEGLQFSNKGKEIIERVRSLVEENEYKLRDCKNGDFFISKIVDPYKGSNEYSNWIRELGLENKYAHQKFIPEVVFLSPLDQRRKFIAGLISTDGYVTKCGIGFCTTSERMAREYLELIRTVGLNGTLSLAAIEKDHHNPLWSVEIKNGKYVKKFHETISVVGKPPKEHMYGEYKNQKNRDWSTSKIRDVEYLGKMEVFDITVDHEDHNYICDGLVTGNSGKSQLAARQFSWVLTETHPSWKRPKEWGEEKLLLICVGKVGLQIEESLAPKIFSYLPPGSYKPEYQGGSLKAIEHENGNRIIFLSHFEAKAAREKLQSFVAHFVWIDELPSDIKILEEAERRVQSKNGMLMVTFTPKVKNEAIKKRIESAKGKETERKYQFSTFDNPVYASEERKQEILDSLSTFSENYRNCVLHGDWIGEETAVYYYDSASMMRTVPSHYSPAWRHVESSDPAASSKFGFTLWAEDPNTGWWYCIKAEQIEGLYDPAEFVDEVIKRTQGYNIVKRISDPHEVWYIRAAKTKGLNYVGPYDKNSRKMELIKNSQAGLSNHQVFITEFTPLLEEQLVDAQWSLTKDKIANGSKYHVLDCFQYFWDCKPKYDGVKISYPSADSFLKAQAFKEKEAREKRAAYAMQQMRRRRR